MVVDLHIHTYPRSQCSNIRPQEMMQEAQRIGLDGLCLTEHQVLWDPEEIEERFGRLWARLQRNPGTGTRKAP